MFADTFGLPKDAPTGLAAKSAARLARFGFATVGSATLAVRTHVPPFPQRWLAALPDYLRDDTIVAA